VEIGLEMSIFSIASVFWNLDTKYSILVAVGFCGSHTTMSSCSILFYKPAISIIVANLGLSLSLGAFWYDQDENVVS
jgi:fluoride ion exporter CrcB/FEX